MRPAPTPTRTVARTAIIAALIILASAAHAATDSPSLAAIATDFRRTPITVTCADSQDEWRAMLEERGVTYSRAVKGFTYPGEPHVWLSPDTCAEVGTSARATFAFLHEIIHTTGERDEAKTSCRALAVFRRFLRRFFDWPKEFANEAYRLMAKTHNCHERRATADP